jgi:hypothetical protein
MERERVLRHRRSEGIELKDVTGTLRRFRGERRPEAQRDEPRRGKMSFGGQICSRNLATTLAPAWNGQTNAGSLRPLRRMSMFAAN